MSYLKVLARDIISKSIIPLTIKGISFSLKMLLPKNSHPNELFKESDFIIWTKELSQLLFSAFDGYISFMLLILFFSLVISVFQSVYQDKNKKIQIPHHECSLNSQRTKYPVSGKMIYLFQLAICSTIVFGCFQFASMVIHNNSIQKQTNQIRTENTHELIQYPYRNLDQIEEDSETLILSPSLNPGEILETLNLGMNAVTRLQFLSPKMEKL